LQNTPILFVVEPATAFHLSGHARQHHQILPWLSLSKNS